LLAASSATATLESSPTEPHFVTLPNGEQSIIGPNLRARLGFVGSPQRRYEANGTTVTASGQSVGLGLCWSPHYDATGLVLLGSVGPMLEARYHLGPIHLSGKTGGNLVFGTLEAQRGDGERLFQSRRWEAFLSLGLGGHW
jgi:hypothetical protein